MNEPARDMRYDDQMRRDEMRDDDQMQRDQLRRDEMRHDEPRHEEEARHVQPVNQSPVTDRYGWSGMDDYKQRFEQLQVQFIEEPKETVKKAEALVEEAVERVISSMHDRVNGIHSELGDDTDDTERLRVAMRRYRELMDSFANMRAA
jgi:histidinol dehydrogenase